VLFSVPAAFTASERANDCVLPDGGLQVVRALAGAAPFRRARVRAGAPSSCRSRPVAVVKHVKPLPLPC